jgi:hypothetical protein
VDFPLSSVQPAPFPWRTAALVALGVAAAALVVLLVAGGALLTGSDATQAATKRSAVKATISQKAKPAAAKAATVSGLPRRRVEVVILNGNGRTGAASSAASRVQRRGYRVGLVGNAPSHDYPSSLVMYRPGFAAEGKRLGRDLGIALVSPLDGMRPRQLHGAHTVVILGG